MLPVTSPSTGRVRVVGRGTLSIIVAFLVILMPGPLTAQAAEFVPGEVIVSYDPDRLERAAVDAIPGVESSAAIGAMDEVRLLELQPGQSVYDTVGRLESQPGVRYAQPNWIYRVKNGSTRPGHRRLVSPFPNDPMFGQLWGLRNAGQNVSAFDAATVFGFRAIDSGAWRAWRFRTAGRTRVAVIDTGISKDHPDLRANLDWKLSRAFAPMYAGGPVRAKNWDDGHGHGTHVAGTIGAVGNNGLGVVGVNWRTRLVALRVCTAEAECDTAGMAAAIDYAGRKKIGVINMSLGSEPDEPYRKNRVLMDALRRHPGTLMVNAAGNETNNNDRKPEWPCSSRLHNLLCVAAIDPRGKLAYFSNWGRKSVDLGAPGQYITSTWANKIFPLDDVFIRDGVSNWISDGWQEATVDGSPVLRFNGPESESWVGPGPPIDLRAKRYCRANASLSGHLSGAQTLVAQYRIGSGGWIRARGVIRAKDLKAEDEPFSFYLGPAAGKNDVSLRFLYRAGATPSPNPLLILSAGEVACIGKMPPGGTYRQLEGSSMASPHVAGIANLVRSTWPKLRGLRLKRVLASTVKPSRSLRGKTVTGGRVDAAGAIRRARQLKRR